VDESAMDLTLHSCTGLRERGAPKARACPGKGAAGWDQNGLNLRRAPRDAGETAQSVSRVRTHASTNVHITSEVRRFTVRPNLMNAGRKLVYTTFGVWHIQDPMSVVTNAKVIIAAD